MALEIEIKFRVPDEAARRSVLAELMRRPDAVRRVTLAAHYLDTADRRLARAGLAWRLRREGRRWVQTLKAAQGRGLARFEHEVPRTVAEPDARAHAGSAPGDHLIRLLAEADAEACPLQLRFRTEVRRTLRLLRTRGATVEVAFDEGWIVAGDQRLRVCEVEFECRSGSVQAMLALAERWRERHRLWLDPQSKAERGDRLADGHRHPALRKAEPPVYDRDADAATAHAAAVDECLDQVLRNAAGLCDGDERLRVEHVHQLRVGIRRLRSALRCYRGWVEPPASTAVDGLRALFAELGRMRDGDVTRGPVADALRAAGAPALPAPAADGALDTRALLRSEEAQRVLLEWVRWRAGGPAAAEVSDRPAAVEDDPPPLAQRAERRLARWHRVLQARAAEWDRLDESAVHHLRKCVKRQRYALEFFAPLLRRRRAQDHLEALARLQERLGALHDLLVARDHHQALALSHPAAWFALGWLAARIVEARQRVRPALERLARQPAPRARAQLGA
jgi:inorganic triphosphatase YgiF